MPFYDRPWPPPSDQPQPRKSTSRRVPKEKEPEVYLRYKAGETVVALCKVYGCVKHTMYRLLRRNGGARSMRDAWDARRKIPRADEPKVVGRYLAGESPQALAKEYGTGSAVVFKMLRRLGVAVRNADYSASGRKGGIAKKERHAYERTKPTATARPYAPPQDLKPAMITRNGQSRAPLRPRFPPLPGQPGYVYG